MEGKNIVRSIWWCVLAVLLAACSGAPTGAGPTPASANAAAPTVSTPSVALSTPGATVVSSVASTMAASASPAGTPLPSGRLASTTATATIQPAGSIQLEMSGPPPVFRPQALTAPAGDVVFYLVNNSPAREEHGGHALAIGAKLGQPFVVSSEIKGGGRAVFTVRDLKPGRYEIWCPLHGHLELGQAGTLTIT